LGFLPREKRKKKRASRKTLMNGEKEGGVGDSDGEGYREI
jgi:hypothetical protein